jgi:DNA modification methylase
MTVEDWPLERITPYPKNARKITQQAIDVVAKSLQEFGWQQPIVVDAQGVIIAGHTRHAAAKQLGWTTAPVHVATNLTPAQVKAYRLMDNRSHEYAGWEMELLGTELLELKGFGLDLSLTGFTGSEIDRLVGPTAGLTDPDEVPEAPEQPVTKPGDLWVMGEHRLLCGDCRRINDTMLLFGGARANLVFTSPPYAEQRHYDESSGFRPIPPDEYVEWFGPVAAGIESVITEDGSYFLNIKPSCEGLDTELYVFDLVMAHVRKWGWHFATEFCWERNGVPKSVTQRFKNQFEPIYQFARGRWKMRPDAVRHESDNVPTAGGPGSGETSWANKQGGFGAESVPGSFGAAKKRRNGTSKAIPEVQGVAKDAGEYIMPGLAYPGNRIPPLMATHRATGHTAAFPVGLPEFFIKAFTDPGDTVYDPFMGSGSTLIAAHQNQRAGYGMELSPAYCDVIVTRWQNFTGQEARREDGTPFAQARERAAVLTP